MEKNTSRETLTMPELLEHKKRLIRYIRRNRALYVNAKQALNLLNRYIEMKMTPWD